MNGPGHAFEELVDVDDVDVELELLESAEDVLDVDDEDVELSLLVLDSVQLSLDELSENLRLVDELFPIDDGEEIELESYNDERELLESTEEELLVRP